MSMTKIAQMVNYSFKKGYDQVPIGKAKEVKKELMVVLNIKSQPAWKRRLEGKTIPKANEIREIEEVFKKIGITQIWN